MKRQQIETLIPCGCCHSKTTHEWMGMEKLPAFLFPLPREKAQLVEIRPIRVNLCPECGHVFQTGVDSDLLVKIYSEHYSYYPYDTDESMASVYRKPFKSFFDKILASQGINGDQLLEIGCSSPNSLRQFMKLGFHCVGVDPSPKIVADISLENVTIRQAFFEDLDFEQEFDIIVSRFNLEHITDLNLHLTKAAKALRPNGIFFVQVPNMAYMMENCQPNFMAHEHTHYFTPASLLSLFQHKGFSFISIEGESSPSIIAAFSRSQPGKTELHSATEQWVAYRQKMDDLKIAFDGIFTTQSPICCYGCGMTLFWLLEQMDQSDFSRIHIMDDNTDFHGMSLPGTGLEVLPPTRQNLAECEQIVLTLNPVYHPAVIQRLKIHSLGKQVVGVTGQMFTYYTI